MKRTKKIMIGIMITIAVVIVASIVSFVFGDNNPEYLVRVEDDGKSNAKENENSTISRWINYRDNTKIEMYTQFKNNISAKIEVAIVVDNSWSVYYNADSDSIQTQNIRTQVTDFSNGIFSNVGTTNAKVSISTNNAKGSMSTEPSVPEISGTSSMLDSGIDNGMQTFSTTDNVRRYMVVFTDATDEVKDKLLELYNNNNIEVTGIIVNLSSNQFINIDGTTVTKELYRYDSTDSTLIDFSNIYSKLKGEMKDVVMEDYFSEKTRGYFDYEFESSSSDVTGVSSTVEPIIQSGKVIGVRTKINSITAEVSMYTRYYLKVRSDISSKIVSYEINGAFIDTSKNLTSTYKYDNVAYKNESTNSPTVQFINNFTVTIFAVNEYQKDLKIPGIQFNVTAKEMTTGRILISNKAYTTNYAGEIKIDGIATLNNIQFTITPTVEVDGYTTTAGEQFELEYDASTKGRKVIDSDDIEWEAEDAKFNTNIYYPIIVNKFNLEVNLTELDNLDSKLGGVDFKLIQPKLNNQVEMNVLEGTTDDRGVLTFMPTVMTKNGTYEYVLSQESSHLGYDSAGIGKIKIAFANGKVQKVETVINDNMQSRKVTDQKVLVQVGNELKLDEKFQIKFNIIA